MVQEVAVLLVDGSEDRRLQESPLVLDEEKPDGPAALRGRTLEAFEESRCTGPGSVGEPLNLLARRDAEVIQGYAVRG